MASWNRGKSQMRTHHAFDGMKCRIVTVITNPPRIIELIRSMVQSYADAAPLGRDPLLLQWSGNKNSLRAATAVYKIGR